jgi:hypothetical protein
LDIVEQQLKAAIERQHGGTVRLAYIDAVSLRLADKPAWEGIVLAFDLKGHPKAERAYAWVSPAYAGSEAQIHIVLHGPAVQSPRDAVRSTLACDSDGVHRTAREGRSADHNTP